MGVILKRKFVRSSSSEEYEDTSGACSIEYFMACKDPYRVAPYNKIPMPWPYQARAASNEASQIVAQISKDAQTILDKCSILRDSVMVRNLSRPGLSGSRETLIINTRSEDTTLWKLAADEIQEIIDRALEKKNTDLKIRVEICNPALAYMDTSSAIKWDSKEHKACLEVENDVFGQVKKCLPGYWKSISFHLRGPRHQLDNRKLTIVITVLPETRHLWDIAETQIQRAIKPSTDEINFQVEIIPGKPILLVSQELEPNPWYNGDLAWTPSQGTSVGPRGSEEAGSFGVWVYFQPYGKTQKELCFLTCHHVVAPGDPQNREENDKFGIGLMDRPIKKEIIMDYPAPMDVNHDRGFRKRIEKDMETASPEVVTVLKRTLERIETLVKNGGIGRVIYSSGIRVKKGRRMDWALVRYTGKPIIGRPPQNEIPHINNFTIDEQQRFPAVSTFNVGPRHVSRVNTLRRTFEWAGKQGRSTGFTAGEVTAVDALVELPLRKGSTVIVETREIEILSLKGGEGWAFPGDSGAMVFNLQKEWLGMVFAADTGKDVGWIISSQEIIDDIKEMTRGEVTLV